MQSIDISFKKYIITDKSPEILVKNLASIVYIRVNIGDLVNVKPIVDKLMNTMRCFLFSMKKRVMTNNIVYELVIYKIKPNNKAWGYWGAEHIKTIEVDNTWAYWKNCKKIQCLQA